MSEGAVALQPGHIQCKWWKQHALRIGIVLPPVTGQVHKHVVEQDVHHRCDEHDFSGQKEMRTGHGETLELLFTLRRDVKGHVAKAVEQFSFQNHGEYWNKTCGNRHTMKSCFPRLR